MFAKLAVTAALCGAIVMGGTEAKKKGPTITNKVFFDVEIGEVPRPLTLGRVLVSLRALVSSAAATRAEKRMDGV